MILVPDVVPARSRALRGAAPCEHPSVPCHPPPRRRRSALASLALVVALVGCSPGSAPDSLQPGAASPRPQPVVEALGPFRHTGRNAFRASVAPVTAARLGSSYRAGCPVGPADLRLLSVTTWGFDGRTHQGEVVVAAQVAADVVQVFRALHAARFPVAKVDTVERYGSDDDRVMAANVTSAFSCRAVTGGTGFSEHAYGTALDVNPVQNPYVRGSTVEPPAGRAYLDRGDVRPGMVVVGDAVTRAFTGVGWAWGGSYQSLKDYQHFSRSGR